MPQIKLIPIKVKNKNLLDPKKMEKVIARTLDVMAGQVKEDFERTTKTWDHKPDFKILKVKAFVRAIGTNDQIYSYVTHGTRPHVIVPKRGAVLRFPKSFRPKTKVRHLTSYGGSKSKGMRYTKIVHHPGTQARQFEEIITEKWTNLAPRLIKTAIQLSDLL